MTEEFYWETVTGKKLKLHEIRDEHLQNIERFLLNRGWMSADGITDRHEKYNLIRDELDRRGLTLLPEQIVAQQKSNDEERPNTNTLEQKAYMAALDIKHYGKTTSLGKSYLKKYQKKYGRPINLE